MTWPLKLSSKLSGSQLLLLYLLPLWWACTGTRNKDAGRCQIPNHVYGKYCFKKAKRKISIAPENMLRRKCLPYMSQFFFSYSCFVFIKPAFQKYESLLWDTQGMVWQRWPECWDGNSCMLMKLLVAWIEEKKINSLKYIRKLQGVHSPLSVAIFFPTGTEHILFTNLYCH